MCRFTLLKIRPPMIQVLLNRPIWLRNLCPVNWFLCLCQLVPCQLSRYFSQYPGQLLLLAPTEEIVFRRDDGETTGLLTMTNTATCAVAYKVFSTFLSQLVLQLSTHFRCIVSHLRSRQPHRTNTAFVRVQVSLALAPFWTSLFTSNRVIRLLNSSVINFWSWPVQLIAIHWLINSWAKSGRFVCFFDLSFALCCFFHFCFYLRLKSFCFRFFFQKTNEASVQQHRLRCSVAPSDAKDEEFSGMSAGANNATAVKLLQEIGPKLDTIIREQERLRDQMKQLRFLLLLLLFLAFAVPYYMLRNRSGGYVSDFHDNGACHSVSAASSPSS